LLSAKNFEPLIDMVGIALTVVIAASATRATRPRTFNIAKVIEEDSPRRMIELHLAAYSGEKIPVAGVATSSLGLKKSKQVETKTKEISTPARYYRNPNKNPIGCGCAESS